jgi:metal-responsive CopG/Arc/MetJ family transcriptional regulator
MEKSQRVVITLPYSMYEAIKELAERNRRTMSEEVRIAIERRLKEQAARGADEGQPVAVSVG